MPKTANLSFQRVADILTPIVSHEMAEAFTDRNSDGFKAPNGCEIGDICETKARVPLGHWRVESYWSDQQQACAPTGPQFNMDSFPSLN